MHEVVVSSAAPEYHDMANNNMAATNLMKPGVPVVLRRGTMSCEGEILQAPRDILDIVIRQLVMKGSVGARSGNDSLISSSISGPAMSSVSSRLYADLAFNDLKDAALLGSTCRGWHEAYQALLLRDIDLSMKVEEFFRMTMEKRQLIRRLTLNHHDRLIKREAIYEVAFGVFCLMLLCTACGLRPGLTPMLSCVANLVALSCTYLLMHTLVLSAGYRLCAEFGPRTTIILGLAAIVSYYIFFIRLVQLLLGIHQVPPQLDLSPWGRSKHTPMPWYPVAMALWPLFGTSHQWRALQTLSCAVAWSFGVQEWRCGLKYVKRSRRSIH